MATSLVYDQLLSEITDDMERAVMKVLIEHAGERVTRYLLLKEVHGFGAYEWAEKHGLANSTADRQNREIIERLQAKDYPIVSSSGQAGYILAADDETTDSYVAELVSRRANLDEKIDHVRKSKRWVKFIREWKANRPAVQTRLL
jgi:hypothetical protein